MGKQRFREDLSREERIGILQTNAERIEQGEYWVPLEGEDLDGKREAFANISITVNQLEREKKDFMEDFKARMKEPKEKQEALLDEIDQRQERRNGKLYHMINYEASTMDSYDEDGWLIASRRLRPDEKRSSKIFNLNTGTNY